MYDHLPRKNEIALNERIIQSGGFDRRESFRERKTVLMQSFPERERSIYK